MTREVEYTVVGLGALGSGAAYQLARRGADVVGIEQFELGHERGASHDHSRILRHSYHTPFYVALTIDAYNDWQTLEESTGQELTTRVGGLDLFPAGTETPYSEYTESLDAWDIDYELLDVVAMRDRFPQFALPDGTTGLYQQRGSIAAAARGTAAMQAEARRLGADLRDNTPVLGLRDLGDTGVEVHTADETYLSRRVIVCADAWTNDVLAGLDWSIPLTTTLEQVTYFQPEHPERFAQGSMPLWIWMDDPCYYGFPTYHEATIKMAEDCGGAEVTGDNRPFDPDQERLQRLADFVAETIPDAGPPVRSKTCLYTLTHDRDFLLGPVPGHESVIVGLGAGHGFKFSPTIGRVLSELAIDGATPADIAAFTLDRPGIAADAPVLWRFQRN
jgi:monomeric sarcosine oxidase